MQAVTREKGSPLLLMRSEQPLRALKCHGCAPKATACVSSCSARVASLLSLSLLCHSAAKDSEKIQSERLHPSMRSPAPCQTRQKGGPEYGMMPWATIRGQKGSVGTVRGPILIMAAREASKQQGPGRQRELRLICCRACLAFSGWIR